MSNNDAPYEVTIRDAHTGVIVDRFRAGYLREAEKLERGISINLDHANYYVVIEGDE